MFSNGIRDVIVIGAGPAGSRTARQLANQGHDVLLVDKRATGFEPVCCTGLVSPNCVREYEIDDSVILRDYHSAKLHTPGGQQVRVSRPESQAFAVDRSAFDRFLMSRAVKMGVQIRLGATVEQIQIQPDLVKVFLSDRQESTVLTARSVVIAAGMNQRLTYQIGLGSVTDFAFGAQLDTMGIEVEDVNLFINRSIAPGFFSWVVPTLPGQAKIGLMVRRQPVESMHRLLALLHERCELPCPNTAKIHCRPIPLKALKRTYHDRVLVVGDAAGQTKTTTGGGLYYGLLCADLAAETLHQALIKDELSAVALQPYQQAWRKRLGKEMLVGRLARQFFLDRLNEKQFDALIHHANNSGLLTRLQNDANLSFDWHGLPIQRLVAGLFGW